MPSELLLGALFSPVHRERFWAAWTRQAEIHGCDTDSARLLPLAFKRRGLFGADLDDPWVRCACDAYRSTWARNHAVVRSATTAVRLLNDSGIDVMPLKGLALIDDFYGDRGLRPMLDADILVRSSSFGPALEVLKSAGYVATFDLSVEFHLRAAELAGPDNRPVDLHRSLFLNPWSDTDEEARWRRSTEGEIDGVAIRRGASADILLHVIFHGTNRDMGGSARWVADALAMIGEGFDFDLLVRLATTHGLGAPAANALEYLRALAGIHVEANILRDLRAAPGGRLTRLSFSAAPGSNRRGIAGCAPPGVHSLGIPLVQSLGVREALRAGRQMTHRKHGSTSAWLRSRRNHRTRLRPEDNEVTIRRSLGIDTDR